MSRLRSRRLPEDTDVMSRLSPIFANLRAVGRCLCFCLCLLLAPSPASAAAQPLQSSWDVLETRPAAGEQCLVCGQAIHDGEIVELRYKGRRFHVAVEMLGNFEGDPEMYFEELEAHSALFDESAAEGPQMKMGWLYFGLYVLIGLVSAALCGYLALSRGRPALRWFAAGLVLNLIAIIALLVTPKGDLSNLPAGVPSGLAKIPATHEPLPCEDCGSSNHPSAERCGGCGKKLSPQVVSETTLVTKTA